MNKDVEFLAEAYLKVLEKKPPCSAAKKGCKCDDCGDCEKNQHIHEAKNDHSKNKELAKKYPPYDKVTRGDIITAAKQKGPKSKRKEEEEIKEAYEMVLEFKHINKKFARRYNKVTAAMLKAEPGSEEYGMLKSEREDLVSILKDHGQTPQDLEAFLQKKEKENPLPEVQDPQSINQYKDSSYTDTADIPSSEGEYEADMHASQAEVSQMPPDAPTPQEVQAVNTQVSQA